MSPRSGHGGHGARTGLHAELSAVSASGVLLVRDYVKAGIVACVVGAFVIVPGFAVPGPQEVDGAQVGNLIIDRDNRINAGPLRGVRIDISSHPACVCTVL